jgi:hypothetical protein
LLLVAGENPTVISERPGHQTVALTLDTDSPVLPAMQKGGNRKDQRDPRISEYLLTCSLVYPRKSALNRRLDLTLFLT